MPKPSAKFQRRHPQRGRQIEVGYVQIGDFRLASRYISETVQDSDLIVSRMCCFEWRYFQ